MQTLWQDLRYGARRLLQQPGFTAVAALTLALGVGANTAIFSVVNGVLLRPLPYKEPERVMMLWEASARVRNNPVSHQNFADWRERQQSFEFISAFSGRWSGPETITGGSEPERAYLVSVYRDFFSVLGVAPIVGRVFLPEEERPGATPVVVVSHGFWLRRLGGNADLTNRRLTIRNRSHIVIGVMPPGFGFPAETDLWLSKEQFGADPSARSSHNYVGLARLKPNVTQERAQDEMTAIARRIAQEDASDRQHNDVNVISVKDQLTGSVRRGLLILFGAVGCVLLIACANVANLTLARALGRRKEIAIRAALGADGARIVRQLLTESLLLAMTGGAVGLLFAYWLVKALVTFGPAIPRVDEIGVDGRAIAFTFGVSLLTSLLCGLAPALSASKPDLNETLKEGGRGAGGGSGLARGALVVAEVALTLVLLIGAGLLIRSLWRVMQTVNDASREEFDKVEKWPKIVGVVGDVKHLGLESRDSADLYFCYAQRPRRIGDMTVTVRTGVEPEALAMALRREVKRLDANLPVSFEAMERIFARSTANRRYNVILLGAFSALALLLAVIGIYGVMSYAVSEGAREIGVRVALGAQSGDVMKLVVGQGLALTLLGVAIGLSAAFGLRRLMAGLLYEVRADDPLTFASVAGLMTFVALLACYFPARRATRIDPIVALRRD